MKSLFMAFLASMIVPMTGLSAETPASTTTTSDQATVVDGNNAFAIDLYDQLRKQSGNLFFSPASISTALAMTYAGAHGDTATEMAKTLHYTLPPQRLHPAMGVLLANLNAPHDGYQLREANALWGQQGDTVLNDFLTLTKSDYGAGFKQVDFINHTEAARLTINQWVAQQTDDKIKDLLQRGDVDSKTKLVLTNAIYFKGGWKEQFDKVQTRDEDFHLSGMQNVKAPMMHSDGGFSYFDGRTFQILEILYKSSELSMIVLLPDDVSGLPALEQAMTVSNTKQWLGQLRPVSKVILTLPKFKMTQQFQLQSALGSMGMPLAFGAQADFSGITGNRDLLISAVIHKAYVDVNEEGTEAAAATAVVMRGNMARMQEPATPVFRADHPFIFLIRDNRSGGILFMGRVADPTK
jgi:serpin B